MSKPYSAVLNLTVSLSLVLTACGGNGPDGTNDDVPNYIPSADTHPCLGVAVTAPDVIELGTEEVVRVDVNNRCDETVDYTSSTPPYSLKLVSNSDVVVWFTPKEITSLIGEYSVPANGTTSYDVPVLLSADEVLPGTYRMIANLYVDRDTGPDATQYEEPLRLESEPQSVEVRP